MRIHTLVVAAALLAPLDSHAQANPLVGKWEVEYERGRRIENGEETAIMGKATLTITLIGDSAAGTIVGPRPDGTLPPPTVLTGKVTPAGVVMVQKTQARMNTNGEERVIDGTITWTLNAAGDTITGTIVRDLPGVPIPMEPSPVKGTRLKS